MLRVRHLMGIHSIDIYLRDVRFIRFLIFFTVVTINMGNIHRSVLTALFSPLAARDSDV
jgi:hypothetical protein